MAGWALGCLVGTLHLTLIDAALRAPAPGSAAAPPSPAGLRVRLQAALPPAAAAPPLVVPTTAPPRP
ncbi:hypothetical protein KAK06_20250, partial [Ideonella sp. 4Y11]|nr:hypothetical protein [Ideonella aquatica]